MYVKIYSKTLVFNPHILNWENISFCISKTAKGPKNFSLPQNFALE